MIANESCFLCFGMRSVLGWLKGTPEPRAPSDFATGPVLLQGGSRLSVASDVVCVLRHSHAGRVRSWAATAPKQWFLRGPQPQTILNQISPAKRKIMSSGVTFQRTLSNSNNFDSLKEALAATISSLKWSPVCPR